MKIKDLFVLGAVFLALMAGVFIGNGSISKTKVVCLLVIAVTNLVNYKMLDKAEPPKGV